MTVKFKNTLLLSGFVSNKQGNLHQKPFARDYEETCIYLVTEKQVQGLVDVLAQQPEFAAAQPKFELFVNDVKHKHFKKFDDCPTFTQYAADKPLISFCEDLSASGFVELSDIVRNSWIPKGVDSIQVSTSNVIYIDNPNEED